jgi:hypothetical protein
MVKNQWEKSARALPPLESAWAEPFTFDVGDAAEEPTTCRKNVARHVATENQQKLGAIRGRTRNSPAKEYASSHLF